MNGPLDRLDLRDVLCGSTTVPTELIEEAVAKGIGAYRCYGSTEHPTISKSGPDVVLADRSLTDGLRLPGLTVRIVDEAGGAAARGRRGRDPHPRPGPDARLPQPTPRTPPRSPATGSSGTGEHPPSSPKAGVLTITGRKKEVIIRGGENISVREVEELLRRHPAVREAAVGPRSHDRYGEQVRAFVRTRGNEAHGGRRAEAFP